MITSEIIKKFNKIVEDLLFDMKSIIGDNYYNKFKLMKKINSTIFIKKFYNNIIPFKDIILDKNPDYFLNTNNVNSIVDDYNEKEFYLNEYNFFREIYFKIDNESKNNLWDILHVLIYLSESYFDIKNISTRDNSIKNTKSFN